MGHTGSVMTVAFDPGTRVATSSERLFNPATGAALPPDRHERQRLPLPEAKRTGVLDPMTAVIVARDRIRRGWSDGGAMPAFRLPVFDGRHRYDVVVTPGAVIVERIAGKSRRIVPVTTAVEPAAGFEASMAKHARQSRGRVVFSADEAFIPLEVVAGNTLGRGVFTLIADCRSDPAPCDALAEKSRIAGAP